MSKKLLTGMIVGLTVALGCVAPAFADSRKVVTLGADLSEAQRQTMLRYFGVKEDQVDIIWIDNDDERAHLGSFVPLEQIGTKTFSCALVSPTHSGGIQVKTANLNWVTCNMIASTLSTSGVKNCQVVAASPFEVSGTGALTGVIMAYETAQSAVLEPTKVELANEELVKTANLSEEVGQSKATAVINATKIEVIENNITDVTEITNIINDYSEVYDVDITVEQSEDIAELMAKIAEQEYDITQLKATLERVQANVAADAGASEEVQKELEEAATQSEELAYEAAIEEATDNGIVVVEEEEESNILDTTDISALEEDGTIVEEGDTTVAVGQEETEASAEDGILEITVSDETSIPVAVDENQTEAPAIESDEIIEIMEADTEEATEETAAEETAAEETVVEETVVEEVVEEETEKAFTPDDLDFEHYAVYDHIETGLKEVFADNTVTDDSGYTVYMSEETAKKLQKLFKDYVLKVFVKGADQVAAEEELNPEISHNIMEETAAQAEDKNYEDQALKQIDKFARRVILKDSEKMFEADMIGSDDALVIYREIVKILESAFDIQSEIAVEEIAEAMQQVEEAQEEAATEEFFDFADEEFEVFDEFEE